MSIHTHALWAAHFFSLWPGLGGAACNSQSANLHDMVGWSLFACGVCACECVVCVCVCVCVCELVGRAWA